MIWKETGVEKDSYMCFFNVSATFMEYYYYMLSCGHFLCNDKYNVNYKGMRPPIFFYMINGTLEVEYESEHYTAKANDVILMNCYKPQRYYCTDKCEFLFFHYDGKSAQTLTDHLIRMNGGPIFTLENHHEIYNNINKVIMELCYEDQTSDSLLSTIVYSTLCMIPKNCKAFHTSVQPNQTVSDKVMEYIDKHITEAFSVQALADYVNLSPCYFSRLFKKETGYSPLEYVSIAKINYAKLMLRTTTVSISEISEYLGYSSSASFINAFKARRGISPNRYRLQAYKSAENPPY